MVIIAGLGNPGQKYKDTRHNTGFSVIDVIAEKHGIAVLEKKHKAMIGKGYIDGQKVILAKPQTYMNLSGESLRELVDYYKVNETEQMIVIYDDISMDVGQLRIRKKGSAGGHNGIKNIISHMGHDTFLRIKVGVGEKPKEYDLVDYVLGHFSEEEKRKIAASAQLADEAVRLMVRGDTEGAMNRYNKKQEV
ncbi:aminoacyl-tRNA hydrolase [Lachnospiraceae bacterium JLR.KK008]